MDLQHLIQLLDHPQDAYREMRDWGLENPERAHSNILDMARAGVTLDLLVDICEQLQLHLPKSSDADMAFNNLERFIVASRSPLSLATLFQRDKEALPTLLQIFATSQHLSDLLMQDPESYDLLRLTEGQPVSRTLLIDEICSEVAALSDERAVLKVLRRYKHRETLRIAYGDIIRRQRLPLVTEQISFLADAIVEASVRTARRTLEEKRGVPRRPDGKRARFVVLALGKLGGIELNYSSDIDLILLSDGEGKTDGPRPVSNQEYFERLSRDIVKLLTEKTELGAAYRVDLRLRPNGDQSPVVIGLENALRYYDVSGRTWERQAFVKARAVAGDIDLGKEFLDQMEAWIYRRYLSRADISGIKALKRRIEQRVIHEGVDARNIKTGHGGIRDIEFVIQFLQLLNGGDLPEIRTGNTLDAIARLADVGCLTLQERSILEDNYSLLRKLEHRLQIMFDLQTHTLPDTDKELERLAIRAGYVDTPQKPALQVFQADLKEKTDLNRKILDHLLHDAFAAEASDPVTDLVLDPDPSPEFIDNVLRPFGFRDVHGAYSNLMALANERVRFLSTRRCRHFLASIAPQLLRAIFATPDPDATLIDLTKVSDSLGGKGVLWELFSFNPPSLQLYVQLCATSPYLSAILTSNPGMIDELLDSLLLDKLPTKSNLHETLNDLCRGAEDLEPILHSFKNSYHLRVGVRDTLEKEDIQATHRSLSDIAEVCLSLITQTEYERLIERYGKPTMSGGERDGQPCSLVVLAMGKLGGREPNYHSDLDIVFLYEGDGQTQHRHRGLRTEPTNNQHFFSQLAQRIIKVVTQLGPHGRLYEVDARLRPTGKSGALAVPLPELERYFFAGPGQLWERQALCKSRIIFGDPEASAAAMRVVHKCIVEPAWRPEFAQEIHRMRFRLEESASKRNLKRGPGGTVDIEFCVQMLQLRNAATHPEVLVPGTLDALAALCRIDALSREDAEYFAGSYRFLRSVESGLRLMNTTARHDLPESEGELKKLAFLLGYESPSIMLDKCSDFTTQNRLRFEAIFQAAVAR